jgi:RNA polymerase sigma-70 factor (ECF subfamily)
VGHRGEDDRFHLEAVACLDSLYRFARSLARDTHVAEDLVQESYVRALRAARRPEDAAGIRPWLFTILHNVWRNERRRPHPESFDARPELVRGVSNREVSRDAELDRRAAAERLAGVLEGLADPYRSVVLLRFGEGFSYQEIAQILGCPAGTVMSRLSRARGMIVTAMAGNRRPADAADPLRTETTSLVLDGGPRRGKQ